MCGPGPDAQDAVPGGSDRGSRAGLVAPTPGHLHHVAVAQGPPHPRSGASGPRAETLPCLQPGAHPAPGTCQPEHVTPWAQHSLGHAGVPRPRAPLPRPSPCSNTAAPRSHRDARGPWTLGQGTCSALRGRESRVQIRVSVSPSAKWAEFITGCRGAQEGGQAAPSAGSHQPWGSRSPAVRSLCRTCLLSTVPRSPAASTGQCPHNLKKNRLTP